MPNTSETGMKPAIISLANSWPVISDVNSGVPGRPPRPRIAVPIAVNCRPVPWNCPALRDTPTPPSPPTADHPAPLPRPAPLRAAYRASTYGPKAEYEPLPDTSACACRGVGRCIAPYVGQVVPPGRPTPKTDAPNTWPTGSNPTALIAANSAVLSAEVQLRPALRSSGTRISQQFASPAHAYPA